MQPVVNCEEFIGKTVGKRRPPNPLQTSPAERAANHQWKNSGIGLRVPEAAFDFTPTKKADQWLMDHLTGKLAN